MRVLAGFFVFLLGCSHYEPRPSHPHLVGPGLRATRPISPAQCDKLNQNVRFWGASTVFSAAIAGSNGIGVASADLKDNQAARIGLGVTIGVLSAWGALSAYLFSDYSKSRDRDCQQVPKL